jgi:2-polyprenyl-3-methyl-5-hydroxy-6-metoxy-1,4-benzoquinol methylase
VHSLELPPVNEKLAGIVEGTPERFVPELMRGELVEAEHLARYWWARGLVEGKVVLDAGCGVGYGSNILVRSGASEVIAVDVAPAALEAAQRHVLSGVRFLEGDVRRLPLGDDSCDVVICFEVLEHLDDAEAALDEFARVLPSYGVLAVSSPNRNVYVPGNPHHRHEFVPEELAAALAARFGNVVLYPQHDWIASAVLETGVVEAGDASTLLPTHVRKAVGRSPGSELYIIALAGNDQLPTPPSTTVLTETTEIRRWIELFEEQRAALSRLDALQADLDDLKEERTAALNLLADAEAELARLRPIVAEAGIESRRMADVQADREAEIRQLNETIRGMHRTRLWRTGSLYWRLRDRVLRP